MIRPVLFGKISLLCCGVLFLVSGCFSTRVVMKTMEVPQSTFSPTSVIVDATSTMIATETSMPSLTPTFASTPIPTATTTPTAMPIPTLSELDRDNLIKEYMNTNGNCNLPCFWGLLPGKSSWQDVQELLMYWNLQVRESPRGTKGYYSARFSVEGSSQIAGGFTFLEQNDIVRVIRFSANDISQAPYYDVSNVLKDLGIPSYVGIDLRIGGPIGFPKVPSYNIIIAYEEDRQTPWLEKPWAILSYNGGALKIGSNYRFCPTNLQLKDLASEEETEWLPKGFSLELQSSESPMSLDELGGISEPPDIESATGLSVQEFYNRIVESEKSVCFDTPIEFWPDF